MLHYIDELNKEDLKGKKVLLRIDLNAPVEGGAILDSFRLERVIETIDFLREKEAQTIIISHCDDKENATLLPAWKYLNGYFPVEFCATYFTPESIDKLLNLKDKGVLLFENIRVNPGEKENDKNFAKDLSKIADIYVNDAFSESHREYASIVGLPEFLPHYGGLIMRSELEHLSKVFSPAHPFLFIVGGAKFSTKVPIVKKYLEKADQIFIGGALANNFFMDMGLEVGKSLVEDGDFGISKFIKNQKILLPVDLMVSDENGSSEILTPDKVSESGVIIDAGPETINQLKKIILESKTVVWNGPLGKYQEGLNDNTAKLAEFIAESTSKHGVETIIGGGDTLAAIDMKNLGHKFSFVSTGGGAMLQYLVNETLPGIQALEK